MLISGGLRRPSWRAGPSRDRRRGRVARARFTREPVALRAIGRAAAGEPTREEILTELDWVSTAPSSISAPARRPLPAQVLPWYIERLGGTRPEQAELQARYRLRRLLRDAQSQLRVGHARLTDGEEPVLACRLVLTDAEQRRWTNREARQLRLSRPRSDGRRVPILWGLPLPSSSRCRSGG